MIVMSFLHVGVCLHILDGHIGVVRCLSLRGDILVSGGDRKRIITWDVKVSEFMCGVSLFPKPPSNAGPIKNNAIVFFFASALIHYIRGGLRETWGRG